MNHRQPIPPFAERPRLCAVLAVLLIILGVLFVSDGVPASPNRRYFPGHEWLVASLSWVLAIFFGYCARAGYLRRPSRNGVS